MPDHVLPDPLIGCKVLVKRLERQHSWESSSNSDSPDKMPRKVSKKTKKEDAKNVVKRNSSSVKPSTSKNLKSSTKKAPKKKKDATEAASPSSMARSDSFSDLQVDLNNFEMASEEKESQEKDCKKLEHCEEMESQKKVPNYREDKLSDEGDFSGEEENDPTYKPSCQVPPPKINLISGWDKKKLEDSKNRSSKKPKGSMPDLHDMGTGPIELPPSLQLLPYQRFRVEVDAQAAGQVQKQQRKRKAATQKVDSFCQTEGGNINKPLTRSPPRLRPQDMIEITTVKVHRSAFSTELMQTLKLGKVGPEEGMAKGVSVARPPAIEAPSVEIPKSRCAPTRVPASRPQVEPMPSTSAAGTSTQAEDGIVFTDDFESLLNDISGGQHFNDTSGGQQFNDFSGGQQFNGISGGQQFNSIPQSMSTETQFEPFVYEDGWGPPLPEQPASMVPIGSAVSKPLVKREDIKRIGRFTDKYKDPSVKENIIAPPPEQQPNVFQPSFEGEKDLFAIDEEDRIEAENRVEAEKQLFGSVLSDDEDFGGTEAEFSDPEDSDNGSCAGQIWNEMDYERTSLTRSPNAERSSETLETPEKVPPKDNASDVQKSSSSSSKVTKKASRPPPSLIAINTNEYVPPEVAEPPKAPKKASPMFARTSILDMDGDIPPPATSSRFERRGQRPQEIVDPTPNVDPTPSVDSTPNVDPTLPTASHRPTAKNNRGFIPFTNACRYFLEYGNCNNPNCRYEHKNYVPEELYAQLQALEPSLAIDIIRHASQFRHTFLAHCSLFCTLLGERGMRDELLAMFPLVERPGLPAENYWCIFHGLVQSGLSPLDAATLILAHHKKRSYNALNVVIMILLETGPAAINFIERLNYYADLQGYEFPCEAISTMFELQATLNDVEWFQLLLKIIAQLPEEKRNLLPPEFGDLLAEAAAQLMGQDLPDLMDGNRGEDFNGDFADEGEELDYYDDADY